MVYKECVQVNVSGSEYIYIQAGCPIYRKTNQLARILPPAQACVNSWVE